MTVAPLTAPLTAPLASRPRRPVVHRAPSLRAAERTLRRTSHRTTARTWGRAGLPGPAVATAGAGVAETAFGLLVVALLAVPLLLWTAAAPAALVGVVAAALGVLHLAWARRIVVGTDFVAVRQLGRYHVAHLDHVRHLELRAMQGGVLCLHTDDGRCMAVRRAELERPAVARALRALAGGGASTRDGRVCALLELPGDATRLRDRYVPS